MLDDFYPCHLGTELRYQNAISRIVAPATRFSLRPIADAVTDGAGKNQTRSSIARWRNDQPAVSVGDRLVLDYVESGDLHAERNRFVIIPNHQTHETDSSTFAGAGFPEHGVVQVREGRYRDLEQMRDWVVAMRRIDSTLAPITDAAFAEGLKNIDNRIAEGQKPRPMGMDLLVLA